MKKIWLLSVVSLVGLAVLTSCAGNADVMPAPSPVVTSSPSTAPMASPAATRAPAASMSPSATDGAGSMTDPMGAAGVNSVADAMRVSELVSNEVEKLSEVDEAEAIVAGNIAIVGVRYDEQYQGGMTERLTEMVKDRVNMVDKTVTAVQVLDDDATMRAIASLRQQLESSAISFEELQTRLLDLANGKDTMD